MVSEAKANIEEIIKQIQSYQPDAPIELVQKAYAFAGEAHRGQYRVSGEEYITHPLGVAKILADLQIDALTISAGLLHDVVEDTPVTLEEIEKQFGKEIAMLVDGVTKLSRMEYKSKEEQQLESYRKMFLAMAKDIRVVLIKLADRLHNMRTLKYMPPAKQKEIARETLEIFAPLANRLGIFSIKWELEDLAFRFLEPEKYYELVEKVKQKRQEREALINEAIKILSERLTAMGIKAEIQGRPKHFYSIYKKMQKDNKDLSEIYDLSAVRVIVDTIKDCYAALGIVHTLWNPYRGGLKIILLCLNLICTNRCILLSSGFRASRWRFKFELWRCIVPPSMALPHTGAIRKAEKALTAILSRSCLGCASFWNGIKNCGIRGNLWKPLN